MTAISNETEDSSFNKQLSYSVLGNGFSKYQHWKKNKSALYSPKPKQRASRGGYRGGYRGRHSYSRGGRQNYSTHNDHQSQSTGVQVLCDRCGAEMSREHAEIVTIEEAEVAAEEHSANAEQEGEKENIGDSSESLDQDIDVVTPESSVKAVAKTKTKPHRYNSNHYKGRRYYNRYQKVELTEEEIAARRSRWLWRRATVYTAMAVGVLLVAAVLVTRFNIFSRSNNTLLQKGTRRIFRRR